MGAIGLGSRAKAVCHPLSPRLPQAYTDELVELHRRLMALRERNVLQQVCGGALAVLAGTRVLSEESPGVGPPQPASCPLKPPCHHLPDREPDRGDRPLQRHQHHLRF